MKNYDYFDHEADIGIIGRGDSIEESFVQAARAVFAYMADRNKVQSKQMVNIKFVESDNEFALVEWLNALLGEARQHGLIFSQFSLKRENDHWTGQAQGEPWRDTLDRGTEVKGATLTMLSVKHTQNTWESRCVVDV